MKKLESVSTLFLLILLSVSLKAQTEKGTLLIGGASDLNLVFQSLESRMDSDFDDLTSTSVVLVPQIGYFIIDDLALGARFVLGYNSYEIDNGDKRRITSFSFSPFVRYFFGEKNIKPYVNGEIGVGVRNQINDSQYFPDSSTDIFTYRLGGGLAIFLNDKVAFDIGAGYKYESNNQDSNNFESSMKIHQIDLEIGIIVLI